MDVFRMKRMVFYLVFVSLVSMVVISPVFGQTSGWTVQTVDRNVGSTSSLDVDDNNVPQIAYYNSTEEDLQYAGWNGPGSPIDNIEPFDPFLGPGPVTTKQTNPSSNPWYIEKIKTQGNVGLFNSIDTDSNTHPHISYSNQTQGSLGVEYIYWDGFQTNIEEVGAVGSFPINDIVLDSSGSPHIIYYNGSSGELEYYKKTNNQWQESIVDKNGGGYASIALDSNDIPHIGYYKGSNSNLLYAKWNGISWQNETVDTTGNVGLYASIALDSNNDPHILYFNETSSNLKYAEKTSGSWDTNVVDNSPSGLSPNIKIDSNNDIHISYIKQNQTTTNMDLIYAEKTGSIWNPQTVDKNVSGSLLVGTTSMDLDSKDVPHISYAKHNQSQNMGNYDLLYAVGIDSPPSPPENLQATSGDKYVNLSWDRPTGYMGSIIKYGIYRNTSGNNKQLVTHTSMTNYNDTGLQNDTTYNYSVTAINTVGEGKHTTNINATPDTQPQSIIDLYDTDNQQGIQGSEVRQAIKCFLFGGNPCIGSQLGNTEIQKIIKAFLFS